MNYIQFDNFDDVNTFRFHNYRSYDEIYKMSYEDDYLRFLSFHSELNLKEFIVKNKKIILDQYEYDNKHYVYDCDSIIKSYK